MDAAALLSRLLRVDTSNPPGRETTAARELADFLAAAGVEWELLGPDPERLNLVARRRGTGGGRTLAFVGHLDVVPTVPEVWDCDPFAAEERDGWIHGRGAVDLKGPLAAWAVALSSLERLRGDVVLVAAADEEVGKAGVGMQWLVEHARDALACDGAIGEGAGERHRLADGRSVYLYSIGERAGTTATITVPGRTGDASLPANGTNPIALLPPLLTRIAEADLAVTALPELAPLRAAAADAPEELASLAEAACRTTAVPVKVRAEGPANQVPASATLELRLQIAPGSSVGEAQAVLEDAVGPLDASVELEEPAGGSRSAAEGPLADALRAAVGDAELLPTIATGYTDLHLLRETFGVPAYGFIPFCRGRPAVYIEGKHGGNERIHVDDLGFQVQAARTIARRFSG